MEKNKKTKTKRKTEWKNAETEDAEIRYPVSWINWVLCNSVGELGYIASLFIGLHVNRHVYMSSICVE